MSEIDGSFYTWLAAQPALMEVALGVAFVTFLAPGVLAAVATALDQLERWLATRVNNPDRQTSSRFVHPLLAARRIS